jgi:pyruvate dehydrogenase E1 component alpha subunit
MTESTTSAGTETGVALAGLNGDQLKEVAYYLSLSRYFDERMEAMYRQGRLPGAVYPGRGQEGTHVAAAYALQQEDSLFTTHRDLSAQLTKGLDLKRVMAQFWGRVDGYTRGRDGNSHVGDWYGAHTYTPVSMLPDGYPVAAGAALAYKMKGEPRVALAICGDGSTSNGRWHESLNVSAIHGLPVVWVVNNNQYAYSTPNPSEFAVPTIAERAAGYGMPGHRVDAENVLDVYEMVHEAVERARAGGGPTLIESVSLRWRGHAGHDAAKYVPAELLERYVRDKDPVKRFRELILASGIVDEEWLGALDERVRGEFDEAYAFALASPFPVGDEVTLGLFAEDGYWLSEPSRDGGTEAS